MSNKPCASRIAAMCWRAGGSSSRVRGSSFFKAPRSDGPIWGFSGSPYGSHIVLVIFLDHPLLRIYLDLLHRLWRGRGHGHITAAGDLCSLYLHVAIHDKPNLDRHLPRSEVAQGGSRLECAVRGRQRRYTADGVVGQDLLVDPFVEEPAERLARDPLHGRLEVGHAGGSAAEVREVRRQPLLEQLIAQHAPQHVQNQRALCIDNIFRYTTVVVSKGD